VGSNFQATQACLSLYATRVFEEFYKITYAKHTTRTHVVRKNPHVFDSIFIFATPAPSSI